MIQLTLSTTLLIFSFIFMKMNHPLAMGLMLLIQTTIMCFITGIMTKTFWFSYILFLIFLGGMLVLFIYTTSLASNEIFTFSTKMFFISILILMTTLLINTFIDKTYLMSMFNNLEMINMDNLNFYSKENSISLYKLYNYPTNLTTILLMNYLLITLIASIKITNLFFGPLRMMN